MHLLCTLLRSRKWQLERNSDFVGLIRWWFRSQLIECKCWRGNHMTQSVNEQVGTLATIEPKGHFIQVSCEMLCADLVPRSDDAAFQERERRFNGVRCDALAVVVPGVFLGRVINGLMIEPDRCAAVGSQFIGDDYVHIGADIFFDVLRESARLRIFGMEKSQIAIALPDANNNLLRGLGSFGAASAHLSPNIGFIHFDGTVKHGLVYFFHSSTNPVAEIPRRLVRTFVLAPEGTLELAGAHALLGFHQQKHCGEPYRQGQVGIVEHGASKYGEVVLALGTVELLVGLDPRDFLPAATWADDAFGPAQLDQNFPAFIIGIEQALHVKERHG